MNLGYDIVDQRMGSIFDPFVDVAKAVGGAVADVGKWIGEAAVDAVKWWGEAVMVAVPVMSKMVCCGGIFAIPGELARLGVPGMGDLSKVTDPLAKIVEKATPYVAQALGIPAPLAKGIMVASQLVYMASSSTSPAYRDAARKKIEDVKAKAKAGDEESKKLGALIEVAERINLAQYHRETMSNFAEAIKAASVVKEAPKAKDVEAAIDERLSRKPRKSRRSRRS